MTDTPFIHIRSTGTSFDTAGQLTCFLGHQVTSSSASIPDGVFVEWTWQSDRLEVRNDRYGFYPLYYFANEREICVSPSLLQLIKRGAPRTLNDAGLAVFFRIGFFLGEDTPFREIHALPPNARLIWANGRLELTTSRSIPKPQPLSREQVIDGYIELFRSAVRRREPADSFAIPLSGGRDSRHIALEVHRNGWRPRAFVTIDPRNSNEAAVARALADRMSVRQEVIAGSPLSLANQQRKNEVTDLCSDEHQWLLSLGDYLSDTRERCIYDGIGGDVLSAGLFLNAERHALYVSDRRYDLAALLLKPADRLILRVVNDDAARRWNYEVAADHLSRELAIYSEAANPVGAFYFWNRTRREIALYSYGLLRNVNTVFAPFVDHALYDFLASVPADVFVDHSLHSEVIKRAYPEFADIPYTAKLGRPSAYYKNMRRFAIDTFFSTVGTCHKSLLRTPYVLSRLGLGALMPRRVKAVQWVAPTAVYICQLQKTISAPLSDHPLSSGPKPEQLLRQ